MTSLPAPIRSATRGATFRRAPLPELAFGAFALLVFVLGLLPTGNSVTEQTLSDYALGPYGELIRVALVCLAGGSYTVAVCFWRIVDGWWKAAFCGLACVWATGCVLDALINTNPVGASTSEGQIHLTVATASFLALLVSALLFSTWVRRRTPEHPFWMAAATLFVLAASAAQIAAVQQPMQQWDGLVERGLFASSICWMLAATRFAERVTGSARARDESGGSLP